MMDYDFDNSHTGLGKRRPGLEGLRSLLRGSFGVALPQARRRQSFSGESFQPEPIQAQTSFNPDVAGLEWDDAIGSYVNADRAQMGTMKGGPYRLLGSVGAPESTADISASQTPLAGQSLGLEGVKRLLARLKQEEGQ